VNEIAPSPPLDASTGAALPAGKPLRWPWVGLLLSLFVPGFGLVRARQFKRGLLWFVGLQLAGFAAACVWVARAIPTAIAVAAFAACIVAGLWMLVDNYRPGRMTFGLWVLLLVLATVTMFVPNLSKLVAAAYVFPTSSMHPTLLSPDAGGPDHILINRAAYWFADPRRGDLVAFRVRGIPGIEAEARYDATQETHFVKRLVGLPGETIEIRDGHVFADGNQLGAVDGIPPFTYVQPSVRPHFSLDPGKYVVPNDSYFVLGDNSPRSSDSRYWGYVPKENVIGKVARIYWPPSRMSVPR
jgi:signal peptidase I